MVDRIRIKAALTGKQDTLVRRAPGWQGALRIHLTRLSTEGLGPRHGKVRRAHQMLNAALVRPNVYSAGSQASHQLNQALEQAEQSD